MMNFRCRAILPVLATLFLACIAVNSLQAAPEQVALLFVFNYSGSTKSGSIDLPKRLSELVVELINKQSPGSFWTEEQTQKKIVAAGLGEYEQIVNFCTSDDFLRVGRKIGADKIAFLEVQGFGEIKREGQKKTYQAQACLIIGDCREGGEQSFAAEGLGETAGAALENTAKNLCNSYFSQPATANTGNMRDENMPVVVNTRSGLFHLPGCRHLPQADLRREYPSRKDAEANGHGPCLICYPRMASGNSFDRGIEDNLWPYGLRRDRVLLPPQRRPGL